MQQLKTFKDLLTHSMEIFTNGHSFEDYTTFKNFMLSETEQIKSIISKETIATLSRFCWHKDKKDKIGKENKQGKIHRHVRACHPK